ncbi:TetR/AcrR family transcriptional regulator [Maricurvus nonylphenolicus]|uniref:TetR/AcrR family transcriptional regulator n=1 Tax=Maricurvus nonylphenolicus TaxID=1008307 RepID=UPI0036F3801D
MTTKEKPAVRKSSKATSKDTVIDAAIRLFETSGVQSSSMADIATEAGISRKTLYRVYEDRASLIEDILNQRLSAIGNKIRKKISSFSDIEEALVEGSIISIAAARRDKLFHKIVLEETNHQLEQYLLLGGGESTKQDGIDTWSPILDKARGKGLIRKDLSNVRILELLVNVQAILLLRDDYGKDEQRSFLKDLLVPAVLNI